MILIKTIEHIKALLAQHSAKAHTIGFVPTMGALHKGHISLIKQCKQSNSICVCSIFVNPTQFNNKVDFEKYPSTIENDINMLEEAGCDILFLPSVDEMYLKNEPVIKYELGYLETILEGKYRPGHFQGVCKIVDKLLAIVNPDELFIGQKDYQQCMVIKKLVVLKQYKTKIKIIPTSRETSGLAMSSRNMRFSQEDKLTALQISQSLFFIKQQIKPGNIEPLKEKLTTDLEKHGFKVDYVEIADAENLNPIKIWDGKITLVALIAAYINDIRLIDNLLIA